VAYTGCAKKVNPVEKLYISGIVAVVFAKFARLIDEDSFHIFGVFH